MLCPQDCNTSSKPGISFYFSLLHSGFSFYVVQVVAVMLVLGIIPPSPSPTKLYYHKSNGQFLFLLHHGSVVLQTKQQILDLALFPPKLVPTGSKNGYF